MTIDVALPRVTRFSIGRVLRDSFVIFGRNILLFGGFFGGVALVMRLLSLFAPVAASFPDPDGGTNWVAFGLTRGLDFVIGGLTEAAVVFATFQCLRGHRATISDVARGLRLAVPIILAGVVYSIPQIASELIEQAIPETAWFVDLVTLVLSVGSFVLMVMWLVYVPAIAIEEKGVFASLGRSAQLTKGRRWAIVGVFVVVMIAVFVPLLAIVSTTDLSIDALTASPLTLFGAIGHVFYALTTAFFAVLVTVAYFYLRIEKEGSGVEDVVSVFD